MTQCEIQSKNEQTYCKTLYIKKRKFKWNGHVINANDLSNATLKGANLGKGKYTQGATKSVTES